jgi:diguanylate cyclase (GGDEF)-like protein
MFYFAGVLILPPFLFCSMIAIAHLVEWIKERSIKSNYLQSWYLQPWNIGMHIIIGVAARMAFNGLNTFMDASSGLGCLISSAAAALGYTLFNHLTVGLALVLARDIPWKESEALNLENLAMDFLMLTMGVPLAYLMSQNIWMTFPALSPLYLIHRALSVPNLRRRASTDPKTGLWNIEHFRKALEIELQRSMRFKRPLTVVVADLDLLRNINNAYGHLAGDAVLIGVANILKKNFREYDIVSRFGGEEFAILMPETLAEDARQRTETIRMLIENTEFEAPITKVKIRVTMSFGIAGWYLRGAATAEGIMHLADLAVYRAKMNGRNCSCIYTDQPWTPAFISNNT